MDRVLESLSHGLLTPPFVGPHSPQTRSRAIAHAWGGREDTAWQGALGSTMHRWEGQSFLSGLATGNGGQVLVEQHCSPV